MNTDTLIKKIESEQLKSGIPNFRVGDSVNVHVKVREGDKERIQQFSGVIIARGGRGINETITVRRISYGVGVERVFPVHSPMIEKFEVVKQGVTRRAKLYYLRNRTGKAATAVKELRSEATSLRN